MWDQWGFCRSGNPLGIGFRFSETPRNTAFVFFQHEGTFPQRLKPSDQLNNRLGLMVSSPPPWPAGVDGCKEVIGRQGRPAWFVRSAETTEGHDPLVGARCPTLTPGQQSILHLALGFQGQVIVWPFSVRLDTRDWKQQRLRSLRGADTGNCLCAAFIIYSLLLLIVEYSQQHSVSPFG